MSAQESLSIILNQPGFPRARPLSSDSKAGITEERATELINYQRNLEELRNTLSQVDSLLAEPPTPEIAAKCASLLGYVAAIDLPQEVKNQEAGRYPPQVQEQVHRALETQGTSTTRSAEAAAYGTAIMQRVAEEAQVRIQLEAKAAYEESRKVYEQQMQFIENEIGRLDAEFLSSPYSPERAAEYLHRKQVLFDERGKRADKYCSDTVSNYPSLSPEDKAKVREDLKEQERQIEKHIKEKEDYLRYLNELMARTTDPEECRKIQLAINTTHADMQGLQEIIGDFQRTQARLDLIDNHVNVSQQEARDNINDDSRIMPDKGISEKGVRNPSQQRTPLAKQENDENVNRAVCSQYASEHVSGGDSEEIKSEDSVEMAKTSTHVSNGFDVLNFFDSREQSSVGRLGEEDHSQSVLMTSHNTEESSVIEPILQRSPIIPQVDEVVEGTPEKNGVNSNTSGTLKTTLAGNSVSNDDDQGKLIMQYVLQEKSMLNG